MEQVISNANVFIEQRGVRMRERQAALQPAEDIKARALTGATNEEDKTTLMPCIKKILGVEEDAMLQNNVNEYITQFRKQGSECSFNYNFLTKDIKIPDQVIDVAISNYRDSLSQEFNKGCDTEDRRILENTKLVQKFDNNKVTFRNGPSVDCEYRYDSVMDFYDIMDILSEDNKAFSIGLRDLKEGEFDVTANSEVFHISMKWLHNQDVISFPKDVNDIYTQDRKIVAIINRGAHWFNMEIHFDSRTKQVNINFANPSGGYQVSIPDDIKQWAKNIALSIKKNVESIASLRLSKDDKKADIKTLIDIPNVEEGSQLKININEPKLFEQASTNGCGPAAKANLKLMMNNKVSIGNHIIERKSMPQEGFILTLQDEIQLRMYDALNKANDDKNNKVDSAGVNGDKDQVEQVFNKLQNVSNSNLSPSTEQKDVNLKSEFEEQDPHILNNKSSQLYVETNKSSQPSFVETETIIKPKKEDIMRLTQFSMNDVEDNSKSNVTKIQDKYRKPSEPKSYHSTVKYHDPNRTLQFASTSNNKLHNTSYDHNHAIESDDAARSKKQNTTSLPPKQNSSQPTTQKENFWTKSDGIILQVLIALLLTPVVWLLLKLAGVFDDKEKETSNKTDNTYSIVRQKNNKDISVAHLMQPEVLSLKTVDNVQEVGNELQVAKVHSEEFSAIRQPATKLISRPRISVTQRSR